MTHGGPSQRKQNKNIDDNHVQYEIPVPPDGGYGWIVVSINLLTSNFKIKYSYN